jgi:hypothetical protein
VVVGELLALSATVLAVAGAVPQVRRLAHCRDLAGVSVLGPMIGLASEAMWAAYLLDAELCSAVAAPVMMLAANAALVVAAVRAGGRFGRALAAAALWGVGMTAIGLAGGWATVGTALGVAYAVQVAPCVWSAYRTAAPTGVAVTAWIANLGEGVLWVAYGGSCGDHALVLVGIVESGAAVAILARIAVRCPTAGLVTPPGLVVSQSRPDVRRLESACR